MVLVHPPLDLVAEVFELPRGPHLPTKDQSTTGPASGLDGLPGSGSMRPRRKQ